MNGKVAGEEYADSRLGSALECGVYVSSANQSAQMYEDKSGSNVG